MIVIIGGGANFVDFCGDACFFFFFFFFFFGGGGER